MATRPKTILLISRILTLYVHYKLWYISLPSSAKQKEKWPQSKFYGERSERMMINFLSLSEL